METQDGGLVNARTALVLASPMDPASVEVCMDLLAGDDPGRQHVLSVLFTRRPDRRIENWKQHVGALPASFEVLTTQEASQAGSGVSVDRVSGPGHLTEIGVSITEHLAEWPDGAPGSVCIHSATAQLQYASAEKVYQFLYTLCDHLSEADVRGHVHLNPGAHDQQTVDTFKTLFDAVVAVDEDEPRIETR